MCWVAVHPHFTCCNRRIKASENSADEQLVVPRGLVGCLLNAELPLRNDSTILRLMPIYEYECASCGRISSHIVLGSEQLQHPECPACSSLDTKRVMSSFAVVETEAGRLNNFDISKPRDESFYRDSRNVGLWAKKRAQEMGVDLGSKFDDTVERARSGKLIKDMT